MRYSLLEAAVTSVNDQGNVYLTTVILALGLKKIMVYSGPHIKQKLQMFVH